MEGAALISRLGALLLLSTLLIVRIASGEDLHGGAYPRSDDIYAPPIMRPAPAASKGSNFPPWTDRSRRLNPRWDYDGDGIPTYLETDPLDDPDNSYERASWR
jgi:hypothetical protein